MKTTRWGILGCGRIAGSFANGLKSVPGATLAAVGSRSAEKAEAFAKEHGFERAHGTYEALTADPDVDVIYVATPHPMHEADSILCLKNGKAVITEKPFTINRIQAANVIATARERGLFLMEAHWSRFIPAMREVVRLISEGAIGEVRMVQADFGFQAAFDPTSRLFDPALGGGALLDVGCYPLSLTVMLLGTPNVVLGLADIGKTGVDEQATMNLGYSDGKLALLSTAVRTNTPQEAVISGSEGSIRIHTPWWKPTVFTLAQNGKESQTITVPMEGNGFNYEAMEVQKCLEAGKLESDIMPHSQTIEIMRIMDTLRNQWGVKYPGE